MITNFRHKRTHRRPQRPQARGTAFCVAPPPSHEPAACGQQRCVGLAGGLARRSGNPRTNRAGAAGRYAFGKGSAP
jgi:hypothetical protein